MVYSLRGDGIWDAYIGQWIGVSLPSWMIDVEWEATILVYLFTVVAASLLVMFLVPRLLGPGYRPPRRRQRAEYEEDREEEEDGNWRGLSAPKKLQEAESYAERYGHYIERYARKNADKGRGIVLVDVASARRRAQGRMMYVPIVALVDGRIPCPQAAITLVKSYDPKEEAIVLFTDRDLYRKEGQKLPYMRLPFRE